MNTPADTLLDIVDDAGHFSHDSHIKSVGWSRRKAKRITDAIVDSGWSYDEGDKQFIANWLTRVIQPAHGGSMGYDVTRIRVIVEAVMQAKWTPLPKVFASSVDVVKSSNTYRIILDGPEEPRTYLDTDIVFEFVASEAWLDIRFTNDGSHGSATVTVQGTGKERNTGEAITYYKGGFGDRKLSNAPEWLKDVCLRAANAQEREFLATVFEDQ